MVLATLGAFSEDICRNCIGLSGAQTKVIKGLKKLRMDLEGSSIPEMETAAIKFALAKAKATAKPPDKTVGAEGSGVSGLDLSKMSDMDKLSAALSHKI